MIFYFSGTGNSLYAAKNIAESQGEKLVSIAKEFDIKNNLFEYEIKENELLGFVFPVYAWGPPKIVLDFISKIKITGFMPYIFSVCTCGDEEGKTTNKIQKALYNRNLNLDSGFTLVMPNNYIFGFDVDSKDVEEEKLKDADQKLIYIKHVIKNRGRRAFELNEGKFPKLKSSIVNNLFNKYALSTKKFYTTDKCTGCRICETICPVHSITVDNIPSWDKSCTQCLACINRCPVKAIQYGKNTINKGRYIHPELKQ